MNISHYASERCKKLRIHFTQELEKLPRTYSQLNVIKCPATIDPADPEPSSSYIASNIYNQSGLLFARPLIKDQKLRLLMLFDGADVQHMQWDKRRTRILPYLSRSSALWQSRTKSNLGAPTITEIRTHINFRGEAAPVSMPATLARRGEGEDRLHRDFLRSLFDPLQIEDFLIEFSKIKKYKLGRSFVGSFPQGKSRFSQSLIMDVKGGVSRATVITLVTNPPK